MMPKPVRIILPLLVGLFVMSGAAMVWLVRHKPQPAAAPPPPASGVIVGNTVRPDLGDLSIPEFTLVDQNGHSITRADLEGHLTVFDVVFTNCPMACPVMTEKMNGLAESMIDLPGVRFVSLCIDPKRDTPERLREYINLHDIKPETARRWTFLTDPGGNDATARRIIEQGLESLIEEDKSIPVTASNGDKIFNIRHPTWFFLLGPDAKVRDIYQSSVDEELARLQRDVRAVK